MAFYLVNAGGIESAEELSGGKLKRFRAQALTMRVFNVGKGEAILLSKKKEAVLFDGGAIVKKRNELLGRALKEYVTQKEISLVSIVATHPHVDHLNALSTLLEADDPSFLAEDAVYYDNGVTMGKWLTETLGGRLNALTSSGRLTVESVTSGTHGLGPKDVEMYHFVDGPSKPKPIYKSIFTTVRYGDASFLFTGDAYMSYEEDLLESPIAGQLSADVLKVTHHGSEHGTSEDFVDRELSQRSPSPPRRTTPGISWRLKLGIASRARWCTTLTPKAGTS